MSEQTTRRDLGGRQTEDDAPAVPLMDVPLGVLVELERLELDEALAEPLCERGVLPGSRLSRVRNSPSGDPIISVDGTLIALRREMARRLFVRETGAAPQA